MSIVALSDHFKDNFYQLKFDLPLNEIIDNLIRKSSIVKLQEAIDLIDFYCNKSIDYNRSISGIEKLVSGKGGLFSVGQPGSSSLASPQMTAVVAFNKLLEVTTAQGKNGEYKNKLITDASVLAKKYLFKVTATLQEKKEVTSAHMKSLSILEKQLATSKTEYINNSEALARFEVDNSEVLKELIEQLTVQDSKERKSLFGDPARDQVLIDGRKMDKEDFLVLLTKVFNGVKNNLKTSISFYGKRESLEFIGTDIQDYIVNFIKDIKDPFSLCNDMIYMELITPKNVTTFQNSSVSTYEWSDLTLMLVGKLPLPTQRNKSFSSKLSLFTNTKPEEPNSLQKLKKLKDLVDNSIKSYQESIVSYETKMLEFEIMMFETLNELEETFLNMQSSITDLIKEFIFLLGQNNPLVEKLKTIGTKEDLSTLVNQTSMRSKFIPRVKTFENYKSDVRLKSIFGVRLVDLNEIYPSGSSIVVSEILKTISSLPLEKQIVTWTKNLEKAEDLKEVFETRSLINNLVQLESMDLFLENLGKWLRGINSDNLGLLMRRYLLELPDSLIKSTEVNVLNQVFKVSFDIDPGHLKTFYESDSNDNNIEKQNKNVLKLILLYLLKLETLLETEEQQKDVLNKISNNLVHFILKPNPKDGTSAFLKDEYCTVLLNGLLGSLRVR